MRVTITSDLTRDYQVTTISGDGRFGFVHLAEGDYSLIVSVRGYEVRMGDLPLVASVHGDVDNLEVTLDPSGAAQSAH